jgi:hypothetical protein
MDMKVEVGMGTPAFPSFTLYPLSEPEAGQVIYGPEAAPEGRWKRE